MRNVILRVKERFVSISVIFVTAIFLTVFLLVEDELSFTVLMLVGGGLFYFVKRRDCFKEVIVFARQSRYGFLICIFLVPHEYRLLDIKLAIPFSEYTIGLIIIFIYREIDSKR